MNKRDLYMEERRQAILRQVQEAGRVTVAGLSEVYGVSEVTVRADLQALCDQGLLERTHGGAVRISSGLHDLALTRRLRQQVQEKDHIGRVAAQQVEDGEAVFLDSSSTALAIARHLKQRRQLTIITNSLAVAQEMLDAADVTVVMTGGTLQKDTASLIGTEGLAFLRRYNIQKGFFGAHGVAIAEGLTDISADEADVKRPLLAMCRQVIAVADGTKWGRAGLASFAQIEDLDMLITDEHAPAALVERVTGLGVQVIRSSQE